MDMSRSTYAREKLGLAVITLATHAERIPERVAQAIRQLVAVTEDDLPNDLKADFRSLRETVGRGGEHRIDDETATKAANTLLEIESRLNGYLDDFYRTKAG
jgi:hypothetical protein